MKFSDTRLRGAFVIDPERREDARGYFATGQAAKCPGATSIQSGMCARHEGIASAQRGWKRQPGGGWIRLGGDPAMLTASLIVPWTRGNARNSPRV